MHNKQQKREVKLCQPNFSLWQGQKDSNPQQRFWRPTCYHYTIPLSTCLVYHAPVVLSTDFVVFGREKRSGAGRARKSGRAAADAIVYVRIYKCKGVFMGKTADFH